MIVFVVGTIIGIVVMLAVPTPQERKARKNGPQYAYRHPEAAARHTAPKSTVRFK